MLFEGLGFWSRCMENLFQDRSDFFWCTLDCGEEILCLIQQLLVAFLPDAGILPGSSQLFFRNLRGMTQKYLGMMVGFPERSADIRLAQYESETRTPKAEIMEKLAGVLDVSPKAIDLPDIDSYIGLMHTFFALEDRYGLRIGEIDGELCLRLDKSKGSDYLNLLDMFTSWQKEATKLEAGEITKEECKCYSNT